jgi:hypothetical protein
MPTVNLNRMYKVRSQERKPVLNSVNVPDAAGAYLRAVSPAQRAQLGIAEANARLANDKTRSWVEGLRTGLRTGVDAFNAYARAKERQDNVRGREFHNALLKHMADNADAIASEPYAPVETKDGKTTYSGPFSKAMEVLEGFKETDAYKILDHVGKEKRAELEDLYARECYKMQTEAANAQAKLANAHALQEVNKTASLRDGALDRERGGAWKDWADRETDAQNAHEELDRIELGLKDARGGKLREETGADTAELADRRSKRHDGYLQARVEYLADLYAETGDTVYLAEIEKWGNETEGGFSGDADRLRARVLAKQAEKANASKLEQDDMATISAQAGTMQAFALTLNEGEHEAQRQALESVEASLKTPQAKAEWRQKMAGLKKAANTNLLVAAAANMGTPEARDGYLAQLEARLDKDYATEAEKNPWRRQIADAREDNELLDFKTLADSTMRAADPNDFAAQTGAVRELEKSAKSLKSERAKQYAYERIMSATTQTVRLAGTSDSAAAKALSERETARKQQTSALLNYVKYGSRDGGEFKSNDVLDIMREFHRLSAQMTPDEAREIGAALDERIKSAGRDVPSAKEVREVFEWLGWTKGELDKTIGELEGNAVRESAEALILRNAGGAWEISAQRFNAKDDTQSGERDGFAAFDIAGTVRDQQLGKDDISYILGVIHKCKKAALLTGNDYMPEIRKQLADVKEKHRRDSVLAAIRQAQRTIDGAGWMFDRPAEYSTWRPTPESKGYPVPAESGNGKE